MIIGVIAASSHKKGAADAASASPVERSSSSRKAFIASVRPPLHKRLSYTLLMTTVVEDRPLPL